jgi:hypothetical protein
MTRLFIPCVLLVLFLGACERAGPEIQELPPKTAQQVAEEAERQRLHELRAAEAREHQRTFFDTKLKQLTNQQLKQILFDCQAAIMKKAKEDNRGPFEVFMVDEYSADVHQAGAYLGGGAVMTDDARLKRFIAAKSAGQPDLRFALDMRYTVMFTEDTFRGPVKRPQRYSCRLNDQMVPVLE